MNEGMISAKTRNEEALHLLRSDILSGKLLPGQKLAFASLTAQYQVSVGVIREALSRLAEQGLVVNMPQQGFSVMQVSREDLINLTEARCYIESLVLRLSIEHGDMTWESQLVAAHHRLANTPLVSDDDATRLSAEWTEHHSEFHRMLLQGCPNIRLRVIAAQLRDSAELYRQWSIPLSQEPADRDIAGEHAAILEATTARNGELACKLLVTHIERTTELLLDSGFFAEE